MSKLYVFLIGFSVLMLVSRFQPMRGWLKDMLSRPEFYVFMFPLLVLFGWPIDNLESYRAGAELGWQRYARIALFLGFFSYYSFSIVRHAGLRVPTTAPVSIFTVYSVYAGISAIYSPEPLQTAWKAFELLVVLLFSLNLYQSYQLKPVSICADTNAMAYIVFALCLMSTVGGLVAPEYAWRDFGLIGIGERSMAGVAPSVNPNTLGQLGAILFLIALVHWLSNNKTPLLGITFLLLLGVVTLFLAYSRTSMIAVILVASVLLVLLRRYSLVLLVVPLAGITAVVFWDSLLTYLARGQSSEQFASMSGRTNMWEAVLEGWSEKPWFGHGYYVGHKYVWLEGRGFLDTADSTYVETLINLGVLGFALIISFSLTALLLAKKVVSMTSFGGRELFLPAAVQTCFIAVIVIRSLTASSIQVLHYNLLFFLIAIVSLKGIQNTIRSEVWQK